MIKNFDEWNNKKKVVNAKENKIFFHEREVWWCSLGLNVGNEQDGTGLNYDRPVLILRGFNKDICFTVALTGKKKTGPYYFHIGKIEGRDASVLLSQVRLIDKKRLVRKVTTLNKQLFDQIKEILRDILLPMK